MKRDFAVFLDDLVLDRQSDEPLYRQLYRHLRDRILDGRLPAGARLPSTRRFATERAIARNTVLNAFEQLLADGFLEGHIGSGSYVSRRLPVELARPRQTIPPPPAPLGLSARGERILGGDRAREGSASAKIFTPCVPAIDAFPFDLWHKLLNRANRRERVTALAGDGLGFFRLRRSLATYLGAARGVRCTADQVMVVPSVRHAVDLLLRVLADPGDRVLVEDPGYSSFTAACVAAGLDAVSVPLDEEGIDLAGVGAARLAYVTPSHQYPTGVTMSLARRLALIDWSRRHGSWILEDDYDGEFRYDGNPVTALQGLDASGRTIYLGTFGKIMFPSIRLAYIVLPDSLVEPVARARGLLGGPPCAIVQPALADFIEQGYFAAHIRRMRMLYGERRDALLALLERQLGGVMTTRPGGAGMHLVGYLDERWRDTDIADRLAPGPAAPPALSRYVSRTAGSNGLLLGFAASPEAELARGVALIEEAMERARRLEAV